MEISTKYFENISVSREDIIFFEQGIFGFESSKEFILIDFEPGSDNIMCLQSLDDSQLAFVVMNPFNLRADYTPYLSESDFKNLDIDDETEGVLYYVICVVKEPTSESTVNLKCPIVINPKSKKAKQLILDNKEYTFKHTLHELSEEEA